MRERAHKQGNGFGKLRVSDRDGFAQVSSVLALSGEYFTAEQALEVVCSDWFWSVSLPARRHMRPDLSLMCLRCTLPGARNLRPLDWWCSAFLQAAQNDIRRRWLPDLDELCAQSSCIGFGLWR